MCVLMLSDAVDTDEESEYRNKTQNANVDSIELSDF